MKILKTKIFYFLLGAIIFSSITALATVTITAHQITYNNRPVDEVLDDLYSSTNQLITLRETTGDGGQNHLGLGPTTSGSFSVTKDAYYIITIFHQQNIPITVSGLRIIAQEDNAFHIMGIDSNNNYTYFNYRTYYAYTTSDTITVTTNTATRLSYSKIRLFQ